MFTSSTSTKTKIKLLSNAFQLKKKKEMKEKYCPPAHLSPLKKRVRKINFIFSFPLFLQVPY